MERNTELELDILELRLVRFVNVNLNDSLRKHNADCYFEDLGDRYKLLKVTFERSHRELYAKLLRFCADNHFIIVSTHPATYSTVVRLEV